MVWHITHCDVRNTSRPRCCDWFLGSGADFFCAFNQSLNASADWATNTSRMWACCSPQYSAHCPRNSPARFAVNQVVVGWPGTKSFLPFMFGTQKLWITSLDCSSNFTGLPTGTWISFAVVMISLGCGSWYSIFHHHCCPVIL